MPLGDEFKNDLLRLFFHGVAIDNLADNAAASPLTEFFVALHTADPGGAGNQSTNECAYTNYARQSIGRNDTDIDVTANVMSFNVNVPFPAGVSGDNETITHVSVGVALGGATKIIAYGPYSPNQTVAEGVTPRVTDATTLTLS